MQASARRSPASSFARVSRGSLSPSWTKTRRRTEGGGTKASKSVMSGRPAYLRPRPATRRPPMLPRSTPDQNAAPGSAPAATAESVVSMPSAMTSVAISAMRGGETRRIAPPFFEPSTFFAGSGSPAWVSASFPLACVRSIQVRCTPVRAPFGARMPASIAGPLWRVVQSPPLGLWR